MQPEDAVPGAEVSSMLLVIWGFYRFTIFPALLAAPRMASLLLPAWRSNFQAAELLLCYIAPLEFGFPLPQMPGGETKV